MALRSIGMPMLTDDELVAAAARLTTPWRTPLPTVALEDEERALAALVRGARALYVRDLLDVDNGALQNGLAEQLTAFSTRPVGAAVFAADSSGEPLEGSPLQYFFGRPDDAEWLCDSVSAAGVHTFGVDNASQVLVDARKAIDEVLQHGIRGVEVEGAVLTLMADREDGLRQLQVERGRLTACVVSSAGEEPVQLDGATVQHASDWLWGR